MGKILEFMNNDHVELDKEWSEFKSEIENEIVASELFLKFFIHLHKHINLENEVLFRRFEEYSGLDENQGLTAGLRNDHKNIQKLLAAVKSAFVINNLERVKYASLHLHRALAAHAEREKAVPYVLLDKFITEPEWEKDLSEYYKN